MLKNTFIHLPGIGAKKERTFWEKGILTWEDFERNFSRQRSFFPIEIDNTLWSALDDSRAALDRGDFDYFAERLPSNEHYRIALSEPASTVFLDIESTGLSLYYDHTTLIGAADPNQYHLYMKGHDLKLITEVLSKAKCIVTFNGTMFDIKFIRKEFPQLNMPKAHVDLRFFGLPYGIRGTQKHIEQELGLKRVDEIRDMRGDSAPLLWYQYSRGDIEAGRKLIEYNHADIEGMKFIFDAILTKKFQANRLLSKFSKPPRFFREHHQLKWTDEPKDRRADRIFLPPSRAETRPKITYADLAHNSRAANLRVVGIDLTGSEKRPTGWCLLAGSEAITKLIRTDKDIIRETLDAKPDLVSIDSPLSMPKGRIRVTNDDPGRTKFGIMRECERTLKKRGVNVYPSLIDSMQKLTERGIDLSKHLRSLGVPVIESYPGAAQDIMGIPRKRASLEYLKEGLGAFGIAGSFLNTNVSHDEVDAVTSAIVGVFFWSGRFEALGNDDEEYLIIPDLLVPPDPWRNRMVVGFSGPIASGKTTGARFFEKRGFSYGRYSQVLEEILKERGDKVNRQTLQKLGDRIHKKPGQRWLSRELARRLPRDKNLAIDGLRFLEDHAYLVESFGPAFFHIHVTASESVRKKRYIETGNNSSEFQKAILHPVEAKIPRLAEIAGKRVTNDDTMDSYEEQLARIIQEIERIDASDTRDNQVEITADR